MVLGLLWSIVIILVVIIVIIVLLKLVFAVIAIGPVAIEQQQELHTITYILGQTPLRL